jgi:peptidoglycan glycosyltransferase
MCCAILLALSLLTIQMGRIFYAGLTADATALIASDRNEHLKNTAVMSNQGRLIDRGGLAWPLDHANAMDDLAWAGEDARLMFKSMYNALYDDTAGAAAIDRFLLLPEIDPALGASVLYDRKGYDVNVSVSSSLSSLLYRALESTGASRAAGIVANYSTGEVLAYVNMPFGGDDAPDLITEEAFMPGALMNIPTALAVYRNPQKFDVNEYTDIRYECTGKLSYTNTKVVTCPYAHGQLDLAGGFAVNCNCMFAWLASELGTASMQSAAEDLGFNKTQEYMWSRVTGLSVYVPAIRRTEFGLGWSGAGQNMDGWNTAVNVHHLALMINSIAGAPPIANTNEFVNAGGSEKSTIADAIADGGFATPRLRTVLGRTDRETGAYEQLSDTEKIPAGIFNITLDEAAWLRSLMERAAGFESEPVTRATEGENDASAADPSARRFGTRARQLGLSGGAKTGAAQVSDTVPVAEGEQSYATVGYTISWFAGYVSEKSISITIVAERPTVGTAQDAAVKILPQVPGL